LNVLVTGATGFIGSHIARRCLEQGWSVRASVRSASSRAAIADIEHRLELVTCDLWEASDDERARLCDGVELCVHAAWYAVPGLYLASPENLRCLRGSVALIEALASAKCPRVAMIGSCFEYDFAPGRLSETDPLGPASLYAAAKSATYLVGESLARTRGIEFVWARLFYQYGPHEDRRRLVPAVMMGLLRGESVDVTSGLQVRDFLHVSDVASAVVAAARSTLTGAVNVGSGQPVTVREIVETIATLVGGSGRVNFGARPDSPTDPPVVIANVTKLASATGFTPSFDLRRGLADTLAWWQRREVTA